MKRDPRIDLLVSNLDYAFAGRAWHGPTLSSSVRGVSWERAARSTGGRKSIWQQVLHAAYWKQRVINKLIGTQPFPRRGSNWPLLPQKHEQNERAWRADVQLVHDLHAQLRTVVRSLKPSQLNEPMIRLLIGAAHHDVYHAGQIKLLRRLLT